MISAEGKSVDNSVIGCVTCLSFLHPLKPYRALLSKFACFPSGDPDPLTEKEATEDMKIINPKSPYFISSSLCFLRFPRDRSMLPFKLFSKTLFMLFPFCSDLLSTTKQKERIPYIVCVLIKLKSG